MEFHVAGSLEFLEYDIIHSTAGVNKRGRKDRETSAGFDITCCSEKPFGFLERIRIQTAGEDLSACGMIALYALASLVMLSRSMTTFFLHSTRRFALSITISETWQCLCGGSSNVELMISAAEPDASSR